MAKTKSGKREMNPTDAYRKEQRKREIKKNKKERTKVREFSALVRNPDAMGDEIKRLEILDAENKLSKADQIKLVQYKRTHKDLIRIQKREELTAGAAPKVSFDRDSMTAIRKQETSETSVRVEAETASTSVEAVPTEPAASTTQKVAPPTSVPPLQLNLPSFPLPPGFPGSMQPPFLPFPPVAHPNLGTLGPLPPGNFPVAPPPPPPRNLIPGSNAYMPQTYTPIAPKSDNILDKVREISMQAPPPPPPRPFVMQGFGGPYPYPPVQGGTGQGVAGRARPIRPRPGGSSMTIDPLDPTEEGYTMRPSEKEKKARQLASASKEDEKASNINPSFGPELGPASRPTDFAYGPIGPASGPIGPTLPDTHDDAVTGEYLGDFDAVGPYPVASVDVQKSSVNFKKDLIAMVPAHLRMKRAKLAPAQLKPSLRKEVVASVPRPAGSTLLVPRGLKKTTAEISGREVQKSKGAVGDEYATFIAEMKELGAL